MVAMPPDASMVATSPSVGVAKRCHAASVSSCWPQRMPVMRICFALASATTESTVMPSW